MKTQAVHIAIVLGFSILISESGKAADLVSEFTSTNDGWTSVSHSRANPPWPESGVTARDLSPSVANGFLRIQDLNNDWQCIAAPGSFLGDWQRFGGVRLGLVTDDSPTVYEVVLFLSGSVDGITTNSASYTFPITGTPSSSRFDLVAALRSEQWTIISGSWGNLLKNVQQFWIRMDLNGNVAGELDLLDYVRLADSGDLSLKIHPAVELEFFAVAGVINQLQVSSDLQTWKNFGLPFVGDGTQQSRWVRLGDQEEQFFRIVRPQ
ncbi:MAG: hypothetical protein JNN07_03175 [Verrucomicrobiales bacterium]|nr:hypothetical protein [Verrucomicrobiales bacterium]